MKPICYDIEVIQGATLDVRLHWYSESPVHKSIASTAPGWPTVITVAAHGLPADRIPVWITNVVTRDTGIPSACGMAAGEQVFATALTADTIALDINTTGKQASMGVGLLNYFPPVDLTDYTAEWIGKVTRDAATDIFRHTTVDGGVVIVPAEGSIQLLRDAVETAADDFTTGFHQLELTSPDDFVTRFMSGGLSLSRELT